MRGCWLLALRYVTYYWARTAILVAALTICFCLPLATRWIVQRFESEATARANQTPIVIGAKGSQFGLALHALYFRGEVNDAVPQSQWQRWTQSDSVDAIPIHARYRAQGYTVVGSDDAYLRLRKLTLASGQTMERLGDCLLGARVARELKLAAGDRLTTDPDNLFDLSGPSPLTMRVRGVLTATGSADDDVVHCHVRTCWIIAGLGHGHALDDKSVVDPAPESEAEHRHKADRGNLTQSIEVTDANVASFHFHGSESEFPLTAIIAVPKTDKAGTLLLGAYLDPAEKYQAIRPAEIVAEIVRMVAQVRHLIDLLAVVLSLATGLLVILVLWLSLKLRQKEIATLQLLGTSRAQIAMVICLEIVIVGLLSGGLALLSASAIAYSSTWLIYWFLI